jgi:hypothetical protein
MTRRKTATDETRVPVTALEAKRAAVARVLERRREARFASYADPLGGDRVRVQLDGGPGDDLAEAKTVAEWCDDRLARSTPGTPVTDLLVTMWERIRVGGAGAVRDAIGLAAGLDDGAAFSVFMVLNSMPPGPGAIGSAMVREWKRRGLRIMPAASVRLEPTIWDQPSEAAKRVVYRSPLGNPA